VVAHAADQIRRANAAWHHAPNGPVERARLNAGFSALN
jgi:hypothetical protein